MLIHTTDHRTELSASHTCAPAATPAPHHPATVYIASLSARSRRVMFNGLVIAANLLTNNALTPYDLPWHQLRHAHTAALRAALIDTYSPSTANRVLSAVRGVLQAAWRLELIAGDDYHRAIDIANIRATTPDQAAGRQLSQGEINALLTVCQADPSPTGPRDGTIIGLGLYAGLRRFEIAALTLADYEPTQARLTIRRGKGNKARTVYLNPGLTAALADWLTHRGHHPGPLFHAINKGGTLDTAKGITDQSVYELIEKRRQQAQVAPFSPHDLRRTYISNLLDAGTDISTVQRLAGHANANTTASYDRRGETTKPQAAQRLHMPWSRK